MPRSVRTSVVRGLGVALAIGLPVLAAAGQEGGAEAPTAASPPAPCGAAEHREFDFWLGEWEVTLANGQVAGTNRIESILGGCVLQESWESSNGKSVGRSFNIRARDGRWHQTWVDNGGLLLELVGGIVDGRMVMSQDQVRPDGTKVRQEISWEPMPTGQVKQHWRASGDGGRTWTDVFVGTYTKRK